MTRRIAGLALMAVILIGILSPVHAITELAIHEIQFSTLPSGDSPYRDQLITTGGIVTSLFADGYSLQEPMSGPWTGIYVLDTQNRPAPGSFVALSAKVVESDGMTMLTDLIAFAVINAGNPLPRPVNVQAHDLAPSSPTGESLEGVLVGTGKVTIVAVDPALNSWEVKDSTGNTIWVGNRAGYSFVPQVGNDLAALQGIVFASGGRYRLEPRNDGDIYPISPRPSVTGIVRLERGNGRAGVIVQLSGLPTVVTKSDGSYIIESVPPGIYTARAYMPGYLVAERHGIEVRPGHTLELPPVTLVGGDANGDGQINLFDLTLIARNFGQCPPADPWADITRDGCVNLTDLVLVSQNYNKTGPTAW